MDEVTLEQGEGETQPAENADKGVSKACRMAS